MQIAAVQIRKIRPAEGWARGSHRIIEGAGVMEAVIDKIDPAIDIAYGGEQALTAVSIVDRGPVVDSRARVDTVLSLEAGAAVLDLFMAGI